MENALKKLYPYPNYFHSVLKFYERIPYPFSSQTLLFQLLFQLYCLQLCLQSPVGKYCFVRCKNIYSSNGLPC